MCNLVPASAPGNRFDRRHDHGGGSRSLMGTGMSASRRCCSQRREIVKSAPATWAMAAGPGGQPAGSAARCDRDVTDDWPGSVAHPLRRWPGPYSAAPLGVGASRRVCTGQSCSTGRDRRIGTPQCAPRCEHRPGAFPRHVRQRGQPSPAQRSLPVAMGAGRFGPSGAATRTGL